MEYKRASSPESQQQVKFKPRLIIHGGAGNIPSRDKMLPETYAAYRKSLLTIVTKTDTYMRTPLPSSSQTENSPSSSPPPFSPFSPFNTKSKSKSQYPTALATATYAVTLLEDDPLFNAGHGAVFTRDGINELEASVMVSRPSSYAKRGVGVTGLRRVKNPIQLARAILEHGDEDLAGLGVRGREGSEKVDDWGVDDDDDDDDDDDVKGMGSTDRNIDGGGDRERESLDVPSAQGHTLIHGATAERLATTAEYNNNIPLVEPSYFYTQKRWDEHVRGLSRAERGEIASATWSPDEHLPQGTTGAVALDETGLLCVATSTGGMTNKLTGRIGDTPVVGAGFWAEEWVGDAKLEEHEDEGWRSYLGGLSGSGSAGPVVELSSMLRSFLADCLPTPSFFYTPPPPTYTPLTQQQQQHQRKTTTKTRALAISGTGNGDSFMRVSAARSVGAMARWAGVSAAEALSRVAGPGGELQQSAGGRWGRTGEGEGGMIGISIVDEGAGKAVVLHDHNCSGMYRAWIDEGGEARFKIWRDYDDE